MNSEDDTFFEDEYEEEEDDTFPDIEEEEEEEEEYEDVDDGFDEAEFLRPTRGEQLDAFLDDPWPKTVFILVLVGLAIVFLTPPAFYAVWRYFIMADYFLVILGSVGLVYSLLTWKNTAGGRLRWAGITNVFVVLAGVIIGIIDTASWMAFGTSIVPGFETPLLAFCFVLVIFSLYSLWMIQKSFDPARR